uniref:Uncharacterized protein MANES_11G131700 n=1 Tax=Rhizophora mucronata TaxID=61149 RepID=A0A2P2JUQ4_RHIMU
MSGFSGLEVGLSIVFGCLLLAIFAELYYLLWWKKRTSKREIEEDDYGSNHVKQFFHLVCWRKASSVQSISSTSQDGVQNPEVHAQEPDLELGTSKDLQVKASGEESVESELMRLHNLSGPPRLLFTIKEETKEDLECDDWKSRGDRSRKGSSARSLSDIMMTIDTPYLTPLASPRLKSPTFSNPLDSYHQHGFNPLFESSMEAELNRLRSSPPPKFKFLRDAEEKLFRKLMEEAEKRASKINAFVQDSENKAINSTATTQETEGSYPGFIAGKSKEREILHNIPQYPSIPSQVLPLASSPTAFRPLDNKPTVH